MSQQELEQIAQVMNDMGEELSDEELKELLENLSEQLSKGNLSQANIQGQALKGKLATLSSKNEDLIQNMENLNQALASENITSKTEQSGQSGQLGEGQGQGQETLKVVDRVAIQDKAEEADISKQKKFILEKQKIWQVMLRNYKDSKMNKGKPILQESKQ